MYETDALRCVKKLKVDMISKILSQQKQSKSFEAQQISKTWQRVVCF